MEKTFDMEERIDDKQQKKQNFFWREKKNSDIAKFGFGRMRIFSLQAFDS